MRTQKTKRPPNVVKASWTDMSARSRKVAIDEWAVKTDMIEDARQKRAKPDKDPIPDKLVVTADPAVPQPPEIEPLPDSTAKVNTTDLHGTRGDANHTAEDKSNEQLPLVPSDTENEDEQPLPKTATVSTDTALGSGKLLHDGAKPEKLVMRGVADSGTKHCDMKLKDNHKSELQSVLQRIKIPKMEMHTKIQFDDILPQLPVDFVTATEPHREKLTHIGDHNFVCVAENVAITEAMKIPEARAAIQAEWDKLVKQRCWVVESVREYQEVKDEAIAQGRTVHFGRIDPRCMRKHSELDKQFHKRKGRIIYRGDSAKDQDDNFAVYADMASSASLLAGSRMVDATGLLPSHGCEQSDALGAYTETELEGIVVTWISIPKNQHPPEWKKFE